MNPTEFTPFAALMGGAMIGAAAVMLMALNGRVAGVSGIVGRLLPPYADGQSLGRIAFLLGLVLAPLGVAALGQPVVQTVSPDLALMAVAGLLVGFGTGYGGGCTSGHGVCGLARLSRRSLVATLVFMATAIATVFVMRHLVGG